VFTGIIEEIGTVRTIERIAQGAIISVSCSKILDDLAIGDSVAVNGACQTVVKLRNDGFDVEAAPETMNLTTFKYFKEGDKVNLERAMSASSRFGGHMVAGHVDGVGEFKEKVNQGIADVYYFWAPDDIVKYMVYKGSIAINGVSLTIASIKENIFSISVISQTERSTNLIYLKSGDKVNLESDIIAKYVEKFVSKSDNATGNINANYLAQHGFI